MSDRPVGRPAKAEGDKLVPVSTNVPPAVYDALCRRAQVRGVSVAELVREAAISQLKKGHQSRPMPL